jgi:CrcB protein
MRSVIAVFIGGLIGTSARYLVGLALPRDVSEVAWNTIMVNVIGSLLLGLLVASLWRREATPDWLKAGLGAGVLGSFTTFSAVAVGGSFAGLSGFTLIGVLDVGLSVILGLLAAAAGIWLGGRLTRRAASAEVIPDEGVDL